MLKRRLCAFVLLGLFALVCIGSLGSPSSANAVSDYPIRPQRQFVVAAINEYTAEAMTDSYNTFTDDANSYDGDWGTNCYETTAVTTDYFPVAYWDSFDSGGELTGETITNVDVVIRMSVSGTSNDKWGWVIDVSGAETTLRALATGDQSLTNLTYTGVVEPNGGGWTPAEVQAVALELNYDKVAGSDNFDIYIYELCLKVTISSGTAYEKDLTETVTVAETIENAVDYDRYYTESVGVADVITTGADMARNLVESIGVVGALTMVRGREKDLVEAITAADVRTFSIDYARSLTESVAVSDVWAKTFGLNRTESISVIDSGEFSKFISKNMTETIGVADSMTRSVGYSRELTENITVADVRTFSIDYARSLVEAITVVDVRDIVKSGGIDYEKDLTESVGVEIGLETVGGATVITTSIFYQIFLDTNMWGYVGPIGLVICGYFATKYERSLAVLFFLVEMLIVGYYLTIAPESMAYWWHIIILVLGGLFTCIYSLQRR